MFEPEEDPRNAITPSAREQIGDTRWVCEQDGGLVTGWQLIEITGIPWLHFTRDDVRRIAKRGDELSYRRVR